MGFVFTLKTAQADPSSPELEVLPGKKQSSWKHGNCHTDTVSLCYYCGKGVTRLGDFRGKDSLSVYS